MTALESLTDARVRELAKEIVHRPEFARWSETDYGAIPILGALFRFKQEIRSRTNLMIFLRPVIIRSAEDSYRVTTDRYDYLRAYTRGEGREREGIYDRLEPVPPAPPQGAPPPASGAAPRPPAVEAAPAPPPAAPVQSAPGPP